MITRILVPLDGSPSAESVLPAATAFARTCHAPLALLHVIEKHAPPEVHDERHLQELPEAERYLGALQESLGRSGIAATCHVHEGAFAGVPAGIALHVKELSADFIMMCTHGDHRLRRFLWGSIAQQVASETVVPVFLAPPPDDLPPTIFSCRSILLPLDGKKEHEAAVGVAQFLAHTFGAAVFPVLAVPRSSEVGADMRPISRLLPNATGEILDLSTMQGKAYLDGIRGRLEESGLTASSLLLRGDPERSLLRTIKKQKPDLVVLGTHGRIGLNAALEGSVAPKICARCGVPVILVPAGKKSV
jgi:nucleotide-binding universal stress UspA family protein